MQVKGDKIAEESRVVNLLLASVSLSSLFGRPLTSSLINARLEVLFDHSEVAYRTTHQVRLANRARLPYRSVMTQTRALDTRCTPLRLDPLQR